LKLSFTSRSVFYAFSVVQAVSAIPAVTAVSLAASTDAPSSRPVSSPRTVDRAKKESQRNEAEKDYWRGVQYLEGAGVVRDYSAAARFYRKAAEAGYARAQYDLAYL
jgi:TPR repeat protein